MNKQLFSPFLAFMLMAWGVFCVPLWGQVAVRAAEEESTPPLNIYIQQDDDSDEFDCDSWEEAIRKLDELPQSTKLIAVNVNSDIEESFGQWTISCAALPSLQYVFLNLNGHKINGTCISVVGNPEQQGDPLRFVIEDDRYQPVTYDTSAPYTVTNSNTGCITLTSSTTADGEPVGGCIEAIGQATVSLVKGCVVSTDGVCFYSVGDKTGQWGIKSGVYIEAGYVKGRKGCAKAVGKGATVSVTARLVDAQRNVIPTVLECLDFAPVSGDGADEEGNKLGGTTITLKDCVLIGRVETDGQAACGVYHPQQGTLEINSGAHIVAYSADRGGVGVLMRGGTLQMTGGTVEANTNTGWDSFGYLDGVTDYGFRSTGIAYDNISDFYDKDNVKIRISGGEVRAKVLPVSLEEVNGWQELDAISITGGAYYADNAQYAATVARYVAAGYGCVRHCDEDGKPRYYTVEEGEEVQATDVNYHTVSRYRYLKDALVEARNSTIKLLQDFSLTDWDDHYVVGNDGEQTSYALDLNGHTLSACCDYVFNIAPSVRLVVLDSQGGGRIENSGNSLFRLTVGKSENYRSELTIYSGEFDASEELVSFGDGVYYGEALLLGGKYNVSYLNQNLSSSPGEYSHFWYVLGDGLYTSYFHENAGVTLDEAHFWEESGDEDYPWKVSPALKATYGDKTVGVIKDDSECYWFYNRANLKK